MRACLTVLMLVLVISVATVAAAANDRRGERNDDQKWLPGVAIMMTLSGQGTDSSVQSNIRPTDDPGQLIGESQVLLFPSIGGSFELMSPVIVIPRSPVTRST